jgi:hypothetical protein
MKTTQTINTIVEDMPTTIKGFTRSNPDGSYTIVLNARFDYATLQKTCMHEMSHILCEDFSHYSADTVELLRHV